MKSIARTAGLCLVAMITMGMALAGNAFATPLWLLCLEGSASNTKYEDSSCTKAKSTGKWESVALASGKSYSIKLVGFTLKLTDKIKGETSVIKCNGKGSKGSGLLEGLNKGKVFTAEVEEAETNCERVEGSCEAGKVEKVVGADLPWKTEIFETEGKLLTKLEGSVAGKEPGWEVTCKSKLGKITDKCLSPEGMPEQAELVSEVTAGVLLIKGRFEGRSKATCSLGGKEAGEVEGLFALLSLGGSGVSLSKV